MISYSLGITDWDKWMKERHIKLLTPKEIESAAEQIRKETEATKKSMNAMKTAFEQYSEKVRSVTERSST